MSEYPWLDRIYRHNCGKIFTVGQKQYHMSRYVIGEAERCPQCNEFVTHLSRRVTAEEWAAMRILPKKALSIEEWASWWRKSLANKAWDQKQGE